MKKILLIVAFFIGLTMYGQRQFEMNLGAPIGDAGEYYSFAGHLNFNYMFNINDNLKLGPAFGVLYYFGKTIEDPYGDTFKGSNQLILPVTIKGEYTFNERYVVGLNVGYAINLGNEFSEGGLHYRPSFGYRLTEKITAQASFSTINVADVSSSLGYSSFSHFGLGMVFSK